MIEHLRDIAIFAEVVETGSFRGTAKRLGVSPSVVSQRISHLEAHLGTALLYRSTRKLSVTDDGKDLYIASGRMLAAAMDGVEAIMRKKDQLSGRLKLTATANIWERPPFIDHLITFAELHPKVDMSVSFSDVKADLIGSQFDVALRVGWLEDTSYKSTKLMELDRVLVTSSSYLAARPLPKTIEDLAEWDWIKFGDLPITKQLTDKAGTTPTFTAKVAMEVDSLGAICQIVRCGLGVAAVPRHLVRNDLHNGDLVVVPVAVDLFPPGVFAVWPDNVSTDSLVLRFVRFLADRLRGA